MKKMPCLFERTFAGRHVTLHETITPGCEWAVTEGIGSAKFDGTACLIQDGALYARYDAKKGKTPPPGAIPCDDAPDPTTGHWPHWMRVAEQPQYKWHAAALLIHGDAGGFRPGTYELCGPHFQSNPHGFDVDTFVEHGSVPVPLDRPVTFDGLRALFSGEDFRYEGIVFLHPVDGRRCKIRRADFGFPWPLRAAS